MADTKTDKKTNKKINDAAEVEAFELDMKYADLEARIKNGELTPEEEATYKLFTARD